MSAHTFGPWESVEHSWAVTGIYGPSGSGIAQLSIADDATEENQDDLESRQAANARLIAAAPDLLTALQTAEMAMLGYTTRNEALIKALKDARAAIEKATGVTP